MAKMVKKSPVPLYLGAVVWLLWGWFLPLYKLSDILLAAGVSLIVISIGKVIFPNQTYETPEAKAQEAPKAEEKKTETTGNPEIDALIAERDRAVSEMRRLNDSIPDEKLSRQIDHLEETTRKIIAQVVAEPGKLPQIRKFMNYYLPTTIKLLNAYDRMDSTGVSGENIDGTKGRIEEMLDTIVVAFDKQLDSLFSDEALDIATDIRVMENLLHQEGLGESITQNAGGEVQLGL